MRRVLWEGALSLPPLRFSPLNATAANREDLNRAMIEARWGVSRYRFVVEIKAQSTPMIFQDALNRIRRASFPRSTYPMILMPYLNTNQLENLEKEQVSGVDLCGNGIVIVPRKLLVIRSGQPNRYPNSAPIKNIYRKNSSMVSRAFLAKPQFARISDALEEVNRRNLLVQSFDRAPMVMATVSKAIKALEEDLLVSRETGGVRLIQPDKLLDNLLDNYRPDKIESIRRRVNVSSEKLPAVLAKLGRELGLPVAATGLGSVMRYAVMQRGDLLSVYCPQPEQLVARLPGSESERFPNLEVVASEDESVYFDSRLDAKTGFRWACPLQVWLEMMRGDHRDREMAAQVRAEILRAAGAKA